MPHFIGDAVEGGVAINFVGCRFKQFGFVVRCAGSDGVGRHDPNTHTFLATGVDIARHLQSMLRIAGVQTAAVFVFQALLASHKYFPKWPFAQRFFSAVGWVLMLPPSSVWLVVYAHVQALLRVPKHLRSML